MGLFDYFKKGASNKMSGTENENVENIFYNQKTELAYNMYNADVDKSNSMNIPKTIVNTIVNSASTEFDFEVKTQNDNLKKIGRYIHKNIKSIESHLLIGGQVALKPYVTNKTVGVAIYGARDFVAYYDILGELEKVAFKSDIRESQFVSYTLVEIHTYDKESKEYKIEYQLYKNSNTDYNRQLGKMIPSLGSRVPLSRCSKTEDLNDFVVIEDVDRHLCAVTSLQNSLSYGKGESIYNSSIQLINDAERQYESLSWEYVGGELAIDVPKDLLKSNGKNRGYTYPAGKERLYRGLEGADSELGINVFAPQLRDESYIRGLNEILRKIENNCSLYAGALSNVDIIQKTASEVIASKQKFYVLVNFIKEQMKDLIDDSINDCVVVFNRSNLPFMNETVSIEFNIGDSVLDSVSDI